jgi:hypothetical protein
MLRSAGSERGMFGNLKGLAISRQVTETTELNSAVESSSKYLLDIRVKEVSDYIQVKEVHLIH